jgi:hypothetical protein
MLVENYSFQCFKASERRYVNAQMYDTDQHIAPMELFYVHFFFFYQHFIPLGFSLNLYFIQRKITQT